MYLLTEWEGRTGKYLARGHGVRTEHREAVRHDRGPNTLPSGFFCSRFHVRPSYGDFLNSFAMKARAGPYGSYDK